MRDIDASSYLPSDFPLKNVKPDIKFLVAKDYNETTKIRIMKTLNHNEFDEPSNSRKRRNAEERKSDVVANYEQPQHEATLEVKGNNVDGQRSIPAYKRRLFNAECGSSNTSNEVIQQQEMPPPSVGGSTNDSSIENSQPPLPSPTASPTQSHDEAELSDEEMRDSTKGHSYMKVPETEKELIMSVENLIALLPQRQRNALTWRLLSSTDRSNLSILNNLISGSLKRDIISTLPMEISCKILGFLDAKSLIKAELVSSNWYRVVNRSTGLWKLLVKEEKYITTDEELDKELLRKQELLRDWTTKDIHLPQVEVNADSCFKKIYKKRHIIHQRWMDPNFEPKRITVKGHGSAVITCLQFDDDKIITGADDNVISVYDTKSGKLRRTLEGHTGGVWALKYYKNTLVSGATDRTVRIWNIKQGRCTHIFKGHTSTVRCLDILTPQVIGVSTTGSPIVFPPEPLLITGSRDNTIHVWKLPLAGEDDDEVMEPFDGVDANNPYFVRALRGHTASVRCISGWGNIVVTGSYDMTVRVWDLCTGRCKLVLRSHTDRVYSTVLDMKRKRCISGSMDSTVKIWDLEDGHCIATLEGHSSLVGLLDLSETALVSAAADATLRVWDPETGDPRFQLKGHMGAIICFQHDDKKIVSGSERMLRLWDIGTGKFVRELLPGVTGATWQVKFDYRRCISAVQHRQGGGLPDETLMEILDFGEPLNSNMTTDHSHTVVDSSTESHMEID